VKVVEVVALVAVND